MYSIQNINYHGNLFVSSFRVITNFLENTRNFIQIGIISFVKAQKVSRIIGRDPSNLELIKQTILED